MCTSSDDYLMHPTICPRCFKAFILARHVRAFRCLSDTHSHGKEPSTRETMAKQKIRQRQTSILNLKHRVGFLSLAIRSKKHLSIGKNSVLANQDSPRFAVSRAADGLFQALLSGLGSCQGLFEWPQLMEYNTLSFLSWTRLAKLS
jgi:hypothetical protein